jgi:hypothetical protein
MKKTNIFLGLLIALLFSMCTSPKQKGEGLPVLNVADALDAALPDTFTWNSIAKNVRMIPLKTDGLIGNGPSVQYFSDDLIIVTEYHSGVFVFDGEGQEIVSFDHRGMGPKEYLYTTRVNYNKADSLILLYDGGLDKLFRFDLEGKFVDAKSVDVGGTVLNIATDGSMITANREGRSLVSVWDANQQLIGEYFPFDTLYTDKQKLNSWFLSGKGVRGETFNVLPFFSDTVCSITKEGAKPLCILKKGNYKCSSDGLNNMLDVQDSDEYLLNESVSQFSSYLVYGATNQGITQLWDLDTGKLLAWNEAERIGSMFAPMWIMGFRYVFPSGNEFREPSFDYVNQNYGVFIRQADECLDDVPGLTADDNPVLIVLEF